MSRDGAAGRVAVVVLAIAGSAVTCGILSMLNGCGAASEATTFAVDAAHYIRESDAVLEAAYTAEQTACNSRVTDADRRVCVAVARARWAEVWAALGKVRAGWCIADPGACVGDGGAE